MSGEGLDEEVEDGAVLAAGSDDGEDAFDEAAAAFVVGAELVLR